MPEPPSMTSGRGRPSPGTPACRPARLAGPQDRARISVLALSVQRPWASGGPALLERFIAAQPLQLEQLDLLPEGGRRLVPHASRRHGHAALPCCHDAADQHQAHLGRRLASLPRS